VGDNRGQGPTWREWLGVAIGYGVLSVVMTFPLALHPGSFGRVDNGDGQFSIWNVAWVARTLVVDPLHVFDANIFYPNHGTLAYSENNIGAGILAIPVYWATRNAYAAHNFVLLLSFVLSAVGLYALVRYLTASRGAALVSGVCFAFCPYVFAHTPHIQLLMTAGLPLGLLACHGLVDRPDARRGVLLGLAMAAQALLCGYYAVFLVLIVGYSLLVLATSRRSWSSGSFWTAVSIAALVAMAGALPVFLPYFNLQHAVGFRRSVEDSRQYSADWRAYFASSAYAHLWMRGLVGHWKEVLFPGCVASGFGVAGIVVGLRRGGRLFEAALLYGGLATLAGWASFGPDARLYSVLYSFVPAFSLLRAPSRFGVVVVLALSVLAGIAVAVLLEKLRRRTLAAALLTLVTAAELVSPLGFAPAFPIEPAYRVLASKPYGAVLELPVFSYQFRFARARYMLNSTEHWMPLVDAYSDYIPQGFIDRTPVLAGFPSRESLQLLRRDGVRYAVVHLDLYGPAIREALLLRLREFDESVKPEYIDGDVRLYEIVAVP